ncbi:fibronectin type III domain-containing protein [Candidatus Micrarchaeota archaeon]|nr:fibronectin type III domain-containing protein [Candidatus Micrarchaeota archaeon]
MNYLRLLLALLFLAFSCKAETFVAGGLGLEYCEYPSKHLALSMCNVPEGGSQGCFATSSSCDAAFSGGTHYSGGNPLSGSIQFPKGIYRGGNVSWVGAVRSTGVCEAFYLNGVNVCSRCDFPGGEENFAAVSCSIPSSAVRMNAANSWAIYAVGSLACGPGGGWGRIASFNGGLGALQCGMPVAASVKIVLDYFINTPPTPPKIITIPEGIYDKNISINWNASEDKEQNQSSLAYNLWVFDGSWRELANMRATAYDLNLSNLGDGNYSLKLRAGDGFEYGNFSEEINFTVIHFAQKNRLTPGKARAGEPVSWTIDILGKGSGVCTYDIPRDVIKSESVSNSSGEILPEARGAFACNLLEDDYSIRYETPAPVLKEYGWHQNQLFAANASVQHAIGLYGLSNPSLEDYAGVEADFFCPSFGKCNESGIRADLTAGNELNFSIGWEGDALNESLGEWIAEGNLFTQTLKMGVNITNLAEINFSIAGFSVSAVEGNLSLVENESVYWSELFIPAFGAWKGIAELSSDYISDSLHCSREANWERCVLHACNTTPAEFKGIEGKIGLNESFVDSGRIFLKTFENGIEKDITPNSMCPNLDSFQITPARLWKTCKKDRNSNWLVDELIFFIPSFSYVEVEAAGMHLGTDGDPCAFNEDCATGYCLQGKCSKKQRVPWTGSGSSSGGFAGAYVEQTKKAVDQTLEDTSEKSVANKTNASTNSVRQKMNATKEAVDLRILNSVEIGFHEIGVFVEGEPAQGILRITDPKGRRYLREIGGAGIVGFVFDAEGNWRVEYENELKIVEVKKPQNAVAENPSYETPLTGRLVTGFGGVECAALFMIAVLASAFMYKRKSSAKIEKHVNGQKISIEVRPGNLGLKELELIDFTEAMPVVFTEKPVETKETITGVMLVWRKDALTKGNKWIVEYELCSGNQIKTGKARLKAVDKRGKPVVASG